MLLSCLLPVEELRDNQPLGSNTLSEKQNSITKGKQSNYFLISFMPIFFFWKGYFLKLQLLCKNRMSRATCSRVPSLFIVCQHFPAQAKVLSHWLNYFSPPWVWKSASGLGGVLRLYQVLSSSCLHEQHQRWIQILQLYPGLDSVCCQLQEIIKWKWAKSDWCTDAQVKLSHQFY